MSAPEHVFDHLYVSHLKKPFFVFYLMIPILVFTAVMVAFYILSFNSRQKTYAFQTQSNERVLNSRSTYEEEK